MLIFPDVVVLVIFSHDVYRVAPEAPGVGFPVPRFVLRSGRLTTVPYPEQPAWQRLFLVQGLCYVQWRYTSAAFPLNEAIFDRVLELGAQRRFTLHWPLARAQALPACARSRRLTLAPAAR